MKKIITLLFALLVLFNANSQIKLRASNPFYYFTLTNGSSISGNKYDGFNVGYIGGDTTNFVFSTPQGAITTPASNISINGVTVTGIQNLLKLLSVVFADSGSSSGGGGGGGTYTFLGNILSQVGSFVSVNQVQVDASLTSGFTSIANRALFAFKSDSGIVFITPYQLQNIVNYFNNRIINDSLIQNIINQSHSNRIVNDSLLAYNLYNNLSIRITNDSIVQDAINKKSFDSAGISLDTTILYFYSKGVQRGTLQLKKGGGSSGGGNTYFAGYGLILAGGNTFSIDSSKFSTLNKVVNDSLLFTNAINIRVKYSDSTIVYLTPTQASQLLYNPVSDTNAQAIIFNTFNGNTKTIQLKKGVPVVVNYDSAYKILIADSVNNKIYGIRYNGIKDTQSLGIKYKLPFASSVLGGIKYFPNQTMVYNYAIKDNFVLSNITSAQVKSMVKSGGNLVATTDNGMIYAPVSTLIWQNSNVTSNYYNKVINVGSRLVAISGINIIVSDDQGVSWVQTGLGNFQDIAFGNNYIVVVGLTGIIVSADFGTTWNTTNITNQNFSCVNYNNNDFVAGGGANNGIVYMNTTRPYTFIQTNITNGTYNAIGASDSYFFALGNNTGIKYATNPNNFQNTNRTVGTFLSFAYYQGSYFFGGSLAGIFSGNSPNNITALNLTPVTVYAIYFYNGISYAETNVGTYYTPSINGATGSWTKFNSLPSSTFRTQYIVNNTLIVAGTTTGNGIYTSTNTDSSLNVSIGNGLIDIGNALTIDENYFNLWSTGDVKDLDTGIKVVTPYNVRNSIVSSVIDSTNFRVYNTKYNGLIDTQYLPKGSGGGGVKNYDSAYKFLTSDTANNRLFIVRYNGVIDTVQLKKGSGGSANLDSTYVRTTSQNYADTVRIVNKRSGRISLGVANQDYLIATNTAGGYSTRYTNPTNLLNSYNGVKIFYVNNRIYTSTNQGIYSSTDSTNFTILYSNTVLFGDPAYSISDMEIIQQGGNVIIVAVGYSADRFKFIAYNITTSAYISSLFASITANSGALLYSIYDLTYANGKLYFSGVSATNQTDGYFMYRMNFSLTAGSSGNPTIVSPNYGGTITNSFWYNNGLYATYNGTLNQLDTNTFATTRVDNLSPLGGQQITQTYYYNNTLVGIGGNTSEVFVYDLLNRKYLQTITPKYNGNYLGVFINSENNITTITQAGIGTIYLTGYRLNLNISSLIANVPLTINSGLIDGAGVSGSSGQILTANGSGGATWVSNVGIPNMVTLSQSQNTVSVSGDGNIVINGNFTQTGTFKYLTPFSANNTNRILNATSKPVKVSINATFNIVPSALTTQIATFMLLNSATASFNGRLVEHTLNAGSAVFSATSIQLTLSEYILQPNDYITLWGYTSGGTWNLQIASLGNNNPRIIITETQY